MFKLFRKLFLFLFAITFLTGCGGSIPTNNNRKAISADEWQERADACEYKQMNNLAVFVNIHATNGEKSADNKYTVRCHYESDAWVISSNVYQNDIVKMFIGNELMYAKNIINGLKRNMPYIEDYKYYDDLSISYTHERFSGVLGDIKFNQNGNLISFVFPFKYENGGITYRDEIYPEGTMSFTYTYTT